MQMKTTKQIKRDNDYAFKVWIEATDIHLQLARLQHKIRNLMKDINQEQENKTPCPTCGRTV